MSLLDKLDDEAVLKIDNAAIAAYGLHILLAPWHAMDFYMGPGTPAVEAHGRWIGWGMSLVGIQGLVVAASAGSEPAKRNMLKATAAAWLSAMGLNLYYAQKGEMRREVAYTTVGVGAVLTAATFWRLYKRKAGRSSTKGGRSPGNISGAAVPP